MRPLSTLLRAGRAIAVAGAIGCLASGAGCTADNVELSIWKTEWAHTDVGYSATFTRDGSCIYVETEGKRYAAAFPDGTTFKGGEIVTPDETYKLDTVTMIGGGSFSTQEARDVTGLNLASACGSATEVWVVA